MMNLPVTLTCAMLLAAPMVDPPVQDPPLPTEPTSQPDEQPAPTIDHSEFSRLLGAHVEDERIDYLAWKSDDRRALRRYLDLLASTNVGELEQDEQLAFYINLYNATVIREVLARYHTGYTVAEKDYALFKQDTVRLGDAKISLNHLENEIIRKQFKDPRVHVALVCGAVGCPPIESEAYSGLLLDFMLNRKMRAFVNDERPQSHQARCETPRTVERL